MTTPSETYLNYTQDVSIAAYHQINDIVNFAQFTDVYDAYRINKVTLNVEYLSNVASAASASVMPTLYMYWDQDDAAVPASLSSINSKMGVRRIQCGDRMKTQWTMSYKPTVAAALLQGTTDVITDKLGAAEVRKSPWINCLFPTVKHYGVKMVIADLYAPGQNNIANGFRFNWTYDVSFRAPLNLT